MGFQNIWNIYSIDSIELSLWEEVLIYLLFFFFVTHFIRIIEGLQHAQVWFQKLSMKNTKSPISRLLGNGTRHRAITFSPSMYGFSYTGTSQVTYICRPWISILHTVMASKEKHTGQKDEWPAICISGCGPEKIVLNHSLDAVHSVEKLFATRVGRFTHSIS